MELSDAVFDDLVARALDLIPTDLAALMENVAVLVEDWPLEDVVAEVVITVVHEIAHHFGIDDDRLHDLGWG